MRGLTWYEASSMEHLLGKCFGRDVWKVAVQLEREGRHNLLPSTVTKDLVMARMFPNARESELKAAMSMAALMADWFELGENGT